MSEMVERVSRAIREAFTEAELSNPRIKFEELTGILARAAIEEMREPDQRMLDASWDSVRNVRPDERMKVLLMNTSMAHRVKTLNRWRAMISAALSPKPSQES